ncbi:DUF262 domain-containing protein [Pontibacter ramchanderi]|uniref:Uncharacterized protein DUF262 n=1 Tax=Pontibacter ramchanderi TaxID=1179743 RepID=A0A2N3V2N6_9BACT|nr:DUF262 domain-containing protein [Pontibacter ramchanderi]PKV75891.1 uncharacterized protein DUF262 [Pontibacter ramchanderi]
MRQLFADRDSDHCTLIEYVSSFINKHDESYDLIQLPPIQRNSVWRVDQIEFLWDSILRGFPIGSFLLAPREKGQAARKMYDLDQKESSENGYFLLDGQQRTRAILLGFRPNENSRLWIDLNPNMPFGNPAHNNRKFLLRLVTSYQPWGMRDNNPSDKLNEWQKLEARSELNMGTVRYDYQVKIDTGNATVDSENYSWPILSRLPVPLDELIKLCGFTSGHFSIPAWEEVKNLIPKRYNIPDEPTEHFYTIINALQRLLDTTSKDIKTRSVVLLYQNEDNLERSEVELDPMEVLFTRINAGGTVLNGEEMAYSLLKSSWDGAYTMVSKIVNSAEIGYLLPPTGIVMAASRLARFEMGKGDDAKPGISTFRRWISEQNDEVSFLQTMQNLLNEIDGKSIFYRVVEKFCKLVLYRENQDSDFGLPRKLLLFIKPTFYHPVLIWINKNLDNVELLEQNRKRIIRYLLLSYITVDKDDKASKLAITILKESKTLNFPDEEIFSELIKQELSSPIPTPSEFAYPFKSDCDGFFRHWGDIFKIEGDDFGSFRHSFWNKKELMLWYQREFATKWFVGYNPMSNDAYDTPYDYDHIVPRSHIINSGQTNNLFSDDKPLINKFDWNRNLYVNSIGNFRIWPGWANRSDGNNCQRIKLRLEQDDFSVDNVAKELDLPSNIDFLKASAINPEDKELWMQAGGSPRNWPQDRREAFQKAVESRIVNLYDVLYRQVLEEEIAVLELDIV